MHPAFLEALAGERMARRRGEADATRLAGNARRRLLPRTIVLATLRRGDQPPSVDRDRAAS